LLCLPFHIYFLEIQYYFIPNEKNNNPVNESTVLHSVRNATGNSTLGRIPDGMQVSRWIHISTKRYSLTGIGKSLLLIEK
jgi:hypothetical protein